MDININIYSSKVKLNFNPSAYSKITDKRAITGLKNGTVGWFPVDGQIPDILPGTHRLARKKQHNF